MPPSVRIGEVVVPIEAPDEPGIRVALLDVLLDDCYRVRGLAGGCINTVVDIGANVGFFALAARDAFPRAKIQCYEPNSRLVSLLRRHAELIDCVCHGEAVGLDDGFVDLVDHADSVQGRTRASTSGSLKQVSFRNVISRLGGACDLVKLDCEGAEWAILSDTESWQQVRYLTMEYHLWACGKNHDYARLVVENLGFRVDHQNACHSEYGLITASRSR